MFSRTYRPGDRVVFTRIKHTTHPARRARGFRPAANGDNYLSLIDKFWVVSNVLEDGRLVLQTPRGKQRQVDRCDPCLRHATWVERIRYRERFVRSISSLNAVQTS